MERSMQKRLFALVAFLFLILGEHMLKQTSPERLSPKRTMSLS